MSRMKTLAEAIDNARHENAYGLAQLADVTSPDSLDSRGAQFLGHVRDAIVEAIENDPAAALNDERWGFSDTIHEVADAAVPIYTHKLWLAFVDLCAYTEDVSEIDFEYDADSPERLPSVALYIIAERLCHAIVRVIAEDVSE